MRSYYCYTRSVDNEFVRFNVQVNSWEGIGQEAFTEKLVTAAKREIARLGYKVAQDTTIRYVPDDRNIHDAAGYPPVREPMRGAADSYAVVSEYEHGVTVTH